MKKKKLLTDRSGDLQERMLEESAKAMANDIDREVLWGMLEGIGWTRAGCYPRAHFVTADRIKEIHDWVKNNAKGHYENHHTDFIFENSQDAVNFILRWK